MCNLTLIRSVTENCPLERAGDQLLYWSHSPFACPGLLAFVIDIAHMSAARPFSLGVPILSAVRGVRW